MSLVFPEQHVIPDFIVQLIQLPRSKIQNISQKNFFIEIKRGHSPIALYPLVDIITFV